MKKQLLTAIIAMGITFAMGTTAFAGQWIQDTNGWWYNNGNGTYPSGCWQWIDGNQDGVAECYYFNENGYCLLNTATPDGYLVDETGAWTINGTRQMKKIGAEKGNGNITVNREDLTEEQLQKIKYLVDPLGEADNSYMETSAANWSRENILPLLYRYLDIWDIKEIDIGMTPAREDLSSPQVAAYYDKEKVDLLMQSAFGHVWELPSSWIDVPIYQSGKDVVWIGTDPDIYSLEIDKTYWKEGNLYVEGTAFNIYTDGTKVNKGRITVKLNENPASVFGYTIVSISKL